MSLNDVKDIDDPLNNVEAGLVGGDIPLQSVHIKAKLIDLAAQVIQYNIHSLHCTIDYYVNVSCCTGSGITGL